MLAYNGTLVGRMQHLGAERHETTLLYVYALFAKGYKKLG